VQTGRWPKSKNKGPLESKASEKINVRKFFELLYPSTIHLSWESLSIKPNLLVQSWVAGAGYGFY